MGNKIIDIKKGDRISILTYGVDRFYLVRTIIKTLKSKSVILFNSGSNENYYFPCISLKMAYGWDLKQMVLEYLDDYSIAIINCLKEDFNTKETNEFLKFLSEDKKLKNKTFILLINTIYDRCERGEKVTYKHVPSYKKSILKYCNKHFSYYTRENTKCAYSTEWVLEDFDNKTKNTFDLDWETNELIQTN